ncbi:MAG: hypothetical protein Q8934_22175 [Bacillota bacterium]|nr:hypothetical protein [Bacillota bacterium]
MKKNLVAGIFAVGLIVAGGTGYYMASAKDHSANPRVFMQQQGMNANSMIQMMDSSSNKEKQQVKDKTFEQMLPYMKKMHPKLSEEQLKSLYEDMMGENGSTGCQGMMGNLNEDNTAKSTSTGL